MGLPSGVLWAPCNIDIEQPGGFAKSPFQYDCSYFSWGNIDGHNPTSPSSFLPWSWGRANAREPWYNGQVYGDTPGNTLTGNIPVDEEYDAARANLGAPWRLPTMEDFIELFENVIFINPDGSEVDETKADKRVTVNGIVGIYIRSNINGKRLFFACSGSGVNTTLDSMGVRGLYWSSSWVSARDCSCLRISEDIVDTQAARGRLYGFNVRPVMEL